MQTDELLKMLGSELRRHASPPEVGPETLAERHQGRQSLQGLDEGAAHSELAALFSPEVGEGEADWGPSPKALAGVRGLFKPRVASVGRTLILRWVDGALEVLRQSGEWLQPQAMTVRAPGEAARPSQHTFLYALSPFRAQVGLEAEPAGRFGVTLTLESDEQVEPAFRAVLWEGEKRRAVQSGRGGVHLSGIRAGQYRLELLGPEGSLGDIALDVQQEGSGA